MKKIVIAAVWVLVLVILLVAAQNIPTIRHVTEETTTTYEHPTDEYGLDLEGLWQISVARTGEMIMVQEEENATIVCNLEVGGYDYLNNEEIAAKIRDALSKEFDSTEFSTRIGETNATPHETLYFTGMCQKNDATLSSEHYVIHPSEGIRLYVNYFYPPDADSSVIEQGRGSILSIRFYDCGTVYEKYLR